MDKFAEELSRYLQDPRFAVCFFFVFWLGLLQLIAYITGWKQLASHYPYQSEPLTRKIFFQSLSFRFGGGYNGCATVGGNAQGLYLAVLFIFKFGHRPIFIPWQEIKFERKKVFGFDSLKLTFDRCPNIAVTVHGNAEKFFEELKGSPLTVQ